MDALYAWNEIRVGEPGSSDGPGNINTIKPGQAVTQGDTGLDDDQWMQLLTSGSVRKQKYPDMPNTFQGSPVDFLREEMRKAAEGALNDVQTSDASMAAILSANAASTGTALEMGADFTEEQTAQTTFQRNDAGDLFASEDDGQTWRPATEAEKAANP